MSTAKSKPIFWTTLIGGFILIGLAIWMLWYVFTAPFNLYWFVLMIANFSMGPLIALVSIIELRHIKALRTLSIGAHMSIGPISPFVLKWLYYVLIIGGAIIVGLGFGLYLTGGELTVALTFLIALTIIAGLLLVGTGAAQLLSIIRTAAPRIQRPEGVLSSPVMIIVGCVLLGLAVWGVILIIQEEYGLGIPLLIIGGFVGALFLNAGIKYESYYTTSEKKSKSNLPPY